VTEGDLTLKINQARLYTKRGDQDKALRIYDDILLEKPGSVPVLFAKAAIYDATGDKKQAQSLYETILTINESYVPALNNLAFLLLDVYADNERALELATKGFRLKPNDPRIIDTLGYALLKNGQIKKSIVFLEKATSLMPQEASIHFHLAQAYKAAGRKDDAVKSLAAINESNAHEAQIKEAKTLLSEMN
jgi:Flp pilus assembly protein TadD